MPAEASNNQTIPATATAGGLRTIRVSVTQEDIDAGVACDCEKCPIARAMRALGYNATVDDDIVYIWNEELRWEGKKLLWRRLPEVAVRFVAAFDGGQVVEPFEFELVVPA